MNKKSYVITGVVVVVLIAALFIIGIKSQQPQNDGGKYNSFAQCLKDKGLIFYGAFWCPHCRDQKAEFGSAVSLLPYHECSTPDGNDMTADCKAKGIKGYPTWFYPDGSNEEGVQTLAHLAEKSGCTLPQ